MKARRKERKWEVMNEDKKEGLIEGRKRERKIQGENRKEGEKEGSRIRRKLRRCEARKELKAKERKIKSGKYSKKWGGK